ncbi:MAG: hypothetical protein L0322_32030 [Chloroflexi bacterium]|nr:hypothetical protein [Chloroflexota bacterium]
MSRKLPKLLFVLVLFLLALAAAPAGQAQTRQTCANGTFVRLDTRHRVDVDAICAAAQPWQDKGIDIFIYLTDFRPSSENDWFDHLDAVEVDAGLISPDRTIDNFDPDTLALEATINATPQVGITVTFGEELFGTSLDQSAEPVKNVIYEHLRREDPTAAFVEGLEVAYPLAFPYSPWPTIFAGAAIVLAVGGAAVALNRRRDKIGATLGHYRTQWRLARQQRRLLRRLAHLLAVFDQLIKAPAPEDTLLYRLFLFYGGGEYEKLANEAGRQIRLAQMALQRASDQRQQLVTLQGNTLTEQVHQLELVYLELVGTQPRSHHLADQELRDLLLPPFGPAEAAEAPELAEPVAALRRAARKPLAVSLAVAHPSDLELTGVLDYVDNVKQFVVRLVEAETQAPARVAAAEAKYQTAAGQFPANFFLTVQQLFGGVDGRLAEARSDLDAARYVDAWEKADEASAGLDVVNRLFGVMASHEARREELRAITGRGYRPSRLPALEDEIASDLNAIKTHFSQNDYPQAAALLEDFELDSKAALAEARAWQQLHEQNAAALARLEEELARLEAYQTAKGRPAWQALATYPETNWNDLAGALDEAGQMLAAVRRETLPRCQRLNSLDEQQLEAAGLALAEAGASLAQANQRLMALTGRLEEVTVAANTLDEAITLATAELDKIIALRDAEDVKIGPEVDRQIVQVRDGLAAARSYQQARHYLLAAQAQAAARQLAATALATATTQVGKVNELLNHLETIRQQVDAAVPQHLAQAQHLAAVMRTPEVDRAARELEAQWSVAKILAGQTANLEDSQWTAALEQAIVAYQAAETAARFSQASTETARQTYEGAAIKAREAIEAAWRTIRAAEGLRREKGAGMAGQEALNKAIRHIPADTNLEGATREMLERIRREAEQAREYAQTAVNQAKEAILRHNQVYHRQSRDNWSAWSSSSRSSFRSSSSSSSSFRSSSSSRSPSRSSSSSRSSGSTGSRHRR